MPRKSFFDRFAFWNSIPRKSRCRTKGSSGESSTQKLESRGQSSRQTVLGPERLEERFLLATTPWGTEAEPLGFDTGVADAPTGSPIIFSEPDDGGLILRDSDTWERIYPIIVAGDPAGVPSDSPANRVDANTTTSMFAGVGSLNPVGPFGSFICTATPISSRHVLTAAHCVDGNGDGVVDAVPSSSSFFLNFGSNISHTLGISAFTIHPDYTGFGNPSVNDDIAVATLSSNLPTSVPLYPINMSPFSSTSTFTAVGYGTTGDGVTGFIGGSASFTTKRVGQNVASISVFDDAQIIVQMRAVGLVYLG
jgi:hypothetical protein